MKHCVLWFKVYHFAVLSNPPVGTEGAGAKTRATWHKATVTHIAQMYFQNKLNGILTKATNGAGKESQEYKKAAEASE
eukprot:2229856-Pyramimonas_sp.AAC.2